METVTTNAEATYSAPGSPFWQFSVAFYRTPGVSEACLELQDRCAVDVNVLLFLLWMAAERRRVTVDQVRGLIDKLKRWQTAVITPLRMLRRMLKIDAPLVEPAAAEFFRVRVKALELEAERLQQEAMYKLAGGSAFEIAESVQQAARSNMAAYERAVAREFPARFVEVLFAALIENGVSTG